MKAASVNAERDFADGKGRSGRGQTLEKWRFRWLSMLLVME